MEIGERIRQMRIGLGLSQDELAKLVGYKSRSSINKIEIGERDITQSTIVAFAKALHTTPSKLMDWEYAEGTETTVNLCQEHQNVLNLYDQLHDDDKIRIVTKMETIIEDYPENVQQSTIFRAANSAENHAPEITTTTKDFSKIKQSDDDTI